MLPLIRATLLVAAVARAAAAQAPSRDSTAIDALVRPYVESNNFSGQIIAARGGRVLFARAYGCADRERKVANTLATRFHVASVSMQFTAAAVLRLIDQGKLSLDTRVSSLVPTLRGADRITIRNLLEERSGISDINQRPDYAQILQQHQTPASLVAVIANDSLLFSPGSRYVREEHSAYNVLALIAEKVTKQPFATAVRRLVFKPLRMTAAGIDDDAVPATLAMARGYQPVELSGVEPAQPIHWSGKTGNGSAYLSAFDELRWMRALFHGSFLTRSRAAVVDSTGAPVGYGWFRRVNPTAGEFAYEMNGRSPGFASYVAYLPKSNVTVIVFSNIYASVTTEIGSNIVATLLGKPYQPFVAGPPLSAAERDALAGMSFRFGAEFYQPKAALTIRSKDDGLFLEWPGGSLTPLIPQSRDHFIDRAYWVPVAIERNSEGRPVALTYDRFRGVR